MNTSSNNYGICPGSNMKYRTLTLYTNIYNVGVEIFTIFLRFKKYNMSIHNVFLKAYDIKIKHLHLHKT